MDRSLEVRSSSSISSRRTHAAAASAAHLIMNKVYFTLRQVNPKLNFFSSKLDDLYVVCCCLAEDEGGGGGGGGERREGSVEGEQVEDHLHHQKQQQQSRAHSSEEELASLTPSSIPPNYEGPFKGTCRALKDFNPSPYDRHALTYKVNHYIYTRVPYVYSPIQFQ
jgi:hypothetical protein